MMPCRRRHQPRTRDTFLDDPQLLGIRPAPTPTSLHNFKATHSATISKDIHTDSQLQNGKTRKTRRPRTSTFIKGAEAFRHDEKVRKGKTTDTFRYRWFEAVPLREGKDALLVNWIGFEIIVAKSRVKYSMAWVTSLPITNKMSPKSSPAAGPAGRSRTKAST
jgi:hypothetical protein